MAIAGPNLSPLEIGEDLKQKAYRAVKSAILQGSLRPHQLYTEQRLAEQLGVSRTPVREALLTLAAEGWVRYRPRRGVEIIHPTAEDAVHYFQLREAIEGYAAEVLAGRVRERAYERLEEIMELQARCVQRGDLPGYMVLASQFHATLVDELRNPRITDLYARSLEQLRLFGLEALQTTNDPSSRLAEHRELVAILRAGDGARARRLLLKHIRAAMIVLGLATDDSPADDTA